MAEIGWGAWKRRVDDRGYIDSFLRARGKGVGNHFTDEQLIISVQDFFTGGSGTMSKTLAYAILYIVMNPDVQTKIQEEIDAVSNGKICRI